MSSCPAEFWLIKCMWSALFVHELLCINTNCCKLSFHWLAIAKYMFHMLTSMLSCVQRQALAVEKKFGRFGYCASRKLKEMRSLPWIIFKVENHQNQAVLRFIMKLEMQGKVSTVWKLFTDVSSRSEHQVETVNFICGVTKNLALFHRSCYEPWLQWLLRSAVNALNRNTETRPKETSTLIIGERGGTGIKQFLARNPAGWFRQITVLLGHEELFEREEQCELVELWQIFDCLLSVLSLFYMFMCLHICWVFAAISGRLAIPVQLHTFAICPYIWRWGAIMLFDDLLHIEGVCIYAVGSPCCYAWKVIYTSI